MTISEKAAYLRGLVEGQGHDPEAGETIWRSFSRTTTTMRSMTRTTRLTARATIILSALRSSGFGTMTPMSRTGSRQTTTNKTDEPVTSGHRLEKYRGVKHGQQISAAGG